MLKIKNLTKIYKSKKGTETKALNNVSADFDGKGLVFLLGKSGSGKSTLLNLIGGIDNATCGEIIINGRSCSTFSNSDFDSYRNTYIGYVFQEYNLIDNYIVGDNIGLALELQGKKADRAQTDAILRQVELVDDKGETLYDRRIYELSGGQKQRVAVARALIKNPQIILADEPTGALDSKTGQQLYELLQSLAQDKLVIIVTHDKENAEKYGDRIIELKDGAIISDISRAGDGFIVMSTEKNTEKNNPEDCKLIRSKFPLKRSLAMGAGALKVKKFRLAVSILLSVVTFIIFGFTLTASFADEYTAEIKTLYANDQSMFAIQSSSYREEKNGNITHTSQLPLASAQLDEIKKYNNNIDPMLVVSIGEYIKHPLSIYSGNPFEENLGKDNKVSFSDLWNNNPYFRLGLESLGCAAELDSKTGETDANLKPDNRFIDKKLCALPQVFDELAITDLTADMFIRFGYRAADGTVIDIKTPDDLIGKKLGELTICGVYSTEQDKTYFEQFDINGYDRDSDIYLQSYLHGSQSSIITYGFVSKGFAIHKKGSVEANRVLLKLSGNFSKDRAMLDKLNYKEGEQTYSVRLESAFSGFVSGISFLIYFLTDLAAVAVIIVVIVFSIFSALLMMNFITVSIDFKKKELGILRALGARRSDITLICLIESLIIACIDFIVSLVAILILCFALNKIYFISIFNVGFLQIALLFLLCFGVAALATVIPVTRIANKKPVDIINNK